MKSKTTHKIEKVIVNPRVEVDFDLSFSDLHRFTREEGWLLRTPEEMIKTLEKHCKDLEDFLKDQKYDNVIQLRVEHEVQDQCSVCKREWEIYEEDGSEFCAYCGAKVEK